MRVLVTGARGFVMSVFIRQLIESDPEAEVTAIDLDAPDEYLRTYLGDLGERVAFQIADVRDAQGLQMLIEQARPEVVVHGASVTIVPEWEEADPGRYIGINAIGTLRLLEMLRKINSVRHFILISSGAVYGSGDDSRDAVSETTRLAPNEMYGVSKLTAELIARRFAEITATDTTIVRPSKVFGAMERPTSSRSSMSLPFYLAAARRNEVALRITPRTIAAGGDWVSAEDFAAALLLLIGRGASGIEEFNVAGGHFIAVPDLAEMFGVELVDTDDRDAFDMDPNCRHGKDGALSIERLTSATKWRPRELEVQVREYIEWTLRTSGIQRNSSKPLNRKESTNS